MTEVLSTALESGGWSAVIAVVVTAILNHLSFRNWSKRIDRSVTRMELLNLIQHSPEKREIILGKYDDYKELGGNSYMDDVVEKWKAERNG